jgi:branched-chain amino acid aminotransferase
MAWVWHRGTWSEEALSISATDRGLCHGLGVFETLLVSTGQVMDFQEHWQRLEKSCTSLGIPLPEKNLIEEAVAELSARTDLPERVRLRMAATAGSGPLHALRPGDDAAFWMTAAEAAPVSDAINLMTASFPLNERSPLAGIKSACYAEHLIALSEAHRQGADDALLLNTQGHVAEAATANIFLIAGDEILTPSLESGCLPGITRRKIIDLARARNWSLRECRIEPDFLKNADAVWVTSSLRGAVAVASLDGFPLQGADHPRLKEIQSALAQ